MTHANDNLVWIKRLWPPAGFAAHQSHRSLENEIAVDLMNNDVDVMLSGGLRYWIPASANDEQSADRRSPRKRLRSGL